MQNRAPGYFAVCVQSVLENCTILLLDLSRLDRRLTMNLLVDYNESRGG
eukprot:COSAG02_NODE_61470_length_268_cov_0.917160_1_plen_48_part_01